MTVIVHYKDASRPLTYAKVDNTYVKDKFYCVKVGKLVYKHPVFNIWRLIEDY